MADARARPDERLDGAARLTANDRRSTPARAPQSGGETSSIVVAELKASVDTDMQACTNMVAALPHDASKM